MTWVLVQLPVRSHCATLSSSKARLHDKPETCVLLAPQADFWKGNPLGYVELVVDISFAVDIWLNFRTAQYDSKGHLVTDRRVLAKQYLSGWFFLDVLSVVPFDLIIDEWSTMTSMVKTVRIARVAKIMRLLKGYRMLRLIRLPRWVITAARPA